MTFTARQADATRIANAAVTRDRQQRRARREKTAVYWTLQVLFTLFSGLWLMLAIGVVHHDWIRACPTLGFIDSMVLAALIRGALLMPSPISRKDIR